MSVLRPRCTCSVSGERGGDVVGVLTSDAARLPLGCVLFRPSNGRPLVALPSGAPAEVGGGRIVVGDLAVSAAAWWNPRPRLPSLRPALLPEGVRQLRNTLYGEGVPHSAFMLPGLPTGPGRSAGRAARRRPPGRPGRGAAHGHAADRPRPRPHPGRRRRHGGHDRRVWCCSGHPAAERFAAGVYSLAAGRTTELSRALLRHAACGRVSGEYAAVLHGLVGERPLAPAVAGAAGTPARPAAGPWRSGCARRSTWSTAPPGCADRASSAHLGGPLRDREGGLRASRGQPGSSGPRPSHWAIGAAVDPGQGRASTGRPAQRPVTDAVCGPPYCWVQIMSSGSGAKGSSMPAGGRRPPAPPGACPRRGPADQRPALDARAVARSSSTVRSSSIRRAALTGAAAGPVAAAHAASVTRRSTSGQAGREGHRPAELWHEKRMPGRTGVPATRLQIRQAWMLVTRIARAPSSQSSSMTRLVSACGHHRPHRRPARRLQRADRGPSRPGVTAVGLLEQLVRAVVVEHHVLAGRPGRRAAGGGAGRPPGSPRRPSRRTRIASLVSTGSR